jgi:uncharacterized protein RhaS with RHS repeats
MGARVYDPYTGTFTQPDPIQGGGANAYGYTDGDPVNETDVDGDWPCTNSSGQLADVFTNILGAAIGCRDASNIDDTVARPIVATVSLGVITDGAFDGPFEPGEAPDSISGFTRHGMNDAIDREGVGVSEEAMHDAVKNPTRAPELQAHSEGPTYKFTGKNAVVVLNNGGKVVSTWSRNSAAWRIRP